MRLRTVSCESFSSSLMKNEKIPLKNVNANSEYAIIIVETCALRIGEFNTGINGVICGFLCPSQATKSVKPEIKNPNGVSIFILLPKINANIIITNDIKSIVS